MATTAEPPALVHRASGSAAWAPLHRRVFVALWTASLVSNIGTWMQNVGVGWQMTSLTPSPTMVSIVQVATTLPVFLLGLLAGSLADIVDCRRLLIATQAWMLAMAAALAFLAWRGFATPWVLLSLTFGLGIGAALNAPVWQAIIPEPVPLEELPAAVALNGVSMNSSRAIGPALGGLLIAWLGPSAVYALNAASFVGIIVVLLGWRRRESESSRVRGRLGSNRTVALGASLFATATIAIGLTSHASVAAAAAFVSGIRWLCVLSSLNVALQTGVGPRKPEPLELPGKTVYCQSSLRAAVRAAPQSASLFRRK